MAFLLDTHTALWWLMEPEKLGQESSLILRDANTEIYISAVSMFEIAQKQRSGRLPYPEELLNQLPVLFFEQAWQALSISMDHARHAGSYPQIHRDPFDRLLAAQADLEQLTLLTRDPAFTDFPITTCW